MLNKSIKKLLNDNEISHQSKRLLVAMNRFKNTKKMIDETFPTFSQSDTILENLEYLELEIEAMTDKHLITHDKSLVKYFSTYVQDAKTDGLISEDFDKLEKTNYENNNNLRDNMNKNSARKIKSNSSSNLQTITDNNAGNIVTDDINQNDSTQNNIKITSNSYNPDLNEIKSSLVKSNLKNKKSKIVMDSITETDEENNLKNTVIYDDINPIKTTSVNYLFTNAKNELENQKTQKSTI